MTHLAHVLFMIVIAGGGTPVVVTKVGAYQNRVECLAATDNAAIIHKQGYQTQISFVCVPDGTVK